MIRITVVPIPFTWMPGAVQGDHQDFRLSRGAQTMRHAGPRLSLASSPCGATRWKPSETPCHRIPCVPGMSMFSTGGWDIWDCSVAAGLRVVGFKASTVSTYAGTDKKLGGLPIEVGAGHFLST